MLTDILLVASLLLSAIAGSAAIMAVVRIGAISAQMERPKRQQEPDNRLASMVQEFGTRLDDISRLCETLSRQLDSVERQLNELLCSETPNPPAPAPVIPAPGSVTRIAETPLQRTREPVPQPVPEPKMAAPLPAEPQMIPENIVEAAQPAAPQIAPPPLLPSENGLATEVDELVIGYRRAIAGRSKAPIREWLAQNNSITLEVGEDGVLAPGDGGPIAAIAISREHAILLPTAVFVVDFATRFADSQISMRQVMRSCFDAVADNSGEMKLQMPALARREGDRWLLEKPGRLSGFTDAS